VEKKTVWHRQPGAGHFLDESSAKDTCCLYFLRNSFANGEGNHPVFLPMVLQVLQDYASFSSLQNYASL
jgi:hypothetical protein